MAISEGTIEDLTAWCWQADELAEERALAWARFFGDDDPRPIEYWPGTGDENSRERRFLGYFLFHWVMPSGARPVEVAARARFESSFLDEVLTAVAEARYVLAAARSIVARSVYLQVESETWEVRSLSWSRLLRTGTIVTGPLVPTRHRYWVHGPGWVALPIGMTERAGETMTSANYDPVAVERMLQSRGDAADAPAPAPEDSTLRAAVERMTRWAEDHGYLSLVRSQTSWRNHVRKHIPNLEPMAFYQEVLSRVHDLPSVEVANEIVGLATNIWNNTPNPDRGFVSPRQLAKRSNAPPDLRFLSAELHVGAAPRRRTRRG